MSGDLTDEVRIALNLVDNLLHETEGLRKRILEDSPERMELFAVATVLHAFYIGIENTLRRIAAEFDDVPEKGERWHVELLEVMASATNARSAVIDEDLKQQLREYLNFRHVFGNVYLLDLRWERMSHLVRNMEPTFSNFSKQVETFLEAPDTR